MKLPNARFQPATSPKVPRLFLLSDLFPWFITVSAHQASTGVTIHDVLHQLTTFLHMVLAERDIRETTPEHRTAVMETNQSRLSKLIGPPGIRIFDWLVGKTKFGGLIHNPGHVAENSFYSGEAYFTLILE